MHTIRVRLILIISCLILNKTILASVELTEELKELVEMLHSTCQEETEVAEEVITLAKDGNFVEDEKLKCYMMCLMTEMATMDDDGMVDVDAVIALMPKERKRKVAPTIRKCGTQVGVNHCDNAFQTFKCWYINNKEYYYLP